MPVDKAPMTREEFCTHLVQLNGFKLTGPHTLTYADAVDIITVHLQRDVVIILCDGPQTVPTWDVIQVREWPDCYFWDGVLQTVLHKF